MVGQHPRWCLGRFLATSVTTMEVIKREPQTEVTGAIVEPTPTNHRTSYPGGGASKVIRAAPMPFFRPARSANNPESRANERNYGRYARDLNYCITAAVPPVALERFLRSPNTA